VASERREAGGFTGSARRYVLRFNRQTCWCFSISLANAERADIMYSFDDLPRKPDFRSSILCRIKLNNSLSFSQGSHQTFFNIKCKDFSRTFQAQISQIQGPNSASFETWIRLISTQHSKTIYCEKITIQALSMTMVSKTFKAFIFFPSKIHKLSRIPRTPWEPCSAP